MRVQRERERGGGEREEAKTEAVRDLLFLLIYGISVNLFSTERYVYLILEFVFLILL